MPLNKPKSSMLDAGSTAAPQNLGATASAGTGPNFSFADHVHAKPSAADVGAIPSTEKAAANGVASLDANARLNAVQMPALSGDVTLTVGTTNSTAVTKIRGKDVSTPTVAGTIAQYDGTNIVWGSAPAGGSGGGGIVMFFNNGTSGDAPLTNLPALTGGQTYKEFRRAAETGESSIVSPNLTSAYTNIAGFITDLNDPETVEITAGLWDFNVWAQTIDARTLLRAVLYKYDGTTTSWVTLATSAAVSVPTVAGQLVFSLIIPQTTIALTDRIFVVFQALNPAAGHTVTLYFGGSTPSHTHTTLPSVGKSGVVKVINGVIQSDASSIVNEDIADNAAIASSKLATVDIVKGGTGQTEKAAAFNALSPITAAGDLIVGTGANTAGRVAIGTNGQVLTSNGTTVSWATPSGGSGGGGVTTIANGGTGVSTIENARLVMGGVQQVTVRHNSPVTLATAATLTGASWSSGSPVFTFTSFTGTLAVGMSLSAGVNNAVIQSVDSPTQITMTGNPGVSGSGTVTVYNVTTTQLVSSGVFSVDGRNPLVVGDTVLLTAQAASAQNGPWVLQSIGAGLTFVRPSWFTGSFTNPIIVGVALGNSNSGFTLTIAGSKTTTANIIGVDVLSINVLSNRSTIITSSNTTPFSAKQTFAANSTTVNPFSFQASTALLTTPTAHAAEWDGANMYITSLFTGTGTWAAGANPVVTLTSGTTAGLTVGAVVVSGITPTTLTVGSVSSSTQFVLVGTATNSASTATSFTIASRRLVYFADGGQQLRVGGFTETSTNSTVTTAYTFSILNSTFFTITLTNSTPCTFTMPAVAVGKSFSVMVRQPATGVIATALFTNVKWANGSVPTITPTLGKADLFSFVSDGVSWYGSTVQNFTY